MQLVDTHCHIHNAGFELNGDDPTRAQWLKAGSPDPSAMVQTAVHAGVTRLICVGCTLDDSRHAAEFAKDQTHCWVSIGIHPHEAKQHNKQAVMADFSELVKAPKVVAIGECGLDYFYSHSPRRDQIQLLEFQLQLAQDNNLPVIFHVREAFGDFWPVYDNFPGVKGVLHSFTDNSANMQRAIGKGLYIGVNGIATFTKDEAQRQVFTRIPLQNLLLETDAPYLTPAPVRGTINEPKNVTYITRFLAELRGENETTIANATTRNAIKLFRLE